MDARIIFITCPGEHAQPLARAMVEARIAACVTVLPEVQSIYRWEGVVNEGRESLLMVKSSAARIADISAFVKEHHPYSVPEFITVNPAQIEQRYLEWLMGAVAP